MPPGKGYTFKKRPKGSKLKIGKVKVPKTGTKKK